MGWLQLLTHKLTRLSILSAFSVLFNAMKDHVNNQIEPHTVGP